MRHEHFTGLSKGLVATEREKDTDVSHNILNNERLSERNGFLRGPTLGSEKTNGSTKDC